MDGVCDICNQPSWGFEFEGTTETGEKERRHICFECVAKRAQIIAGIDLAKDGGKNGTIDRPQNR